MAQGKRRASLKTDPLTGERLHWVGGVYVSQDALRIAEKVQEYDPNLRIQYLEEAASIGEPPFRIVYRGPDGRDRAVFYAWQLDDRIMQRVYENDTWRNPRLLEVIDKQNERAKKVEEDKKKEVLQEAKDISESIAASPKDSYILKDPHTNEKVKFHTTEPAKKL